MSAGYGLQALLSLALCTGLGMAVRIVLDPRRSLVAAADRVKSWLESRQANMVWKGMALAALLLSVVIGVQQIRMTGCQARYNEASNISQRARAEAAATDREALDRMLLAVADDPRSAIVAIRAYNESRRQADVQRAANPVPPPPSETCGRWQPW